MAVAEPFVVDASITLSWCFEDESSPAADDVLARLESGRAVAPSVWTLEVSNALRSAQRRGRLTDVETPVLISLLLALPIDVDDTLSLDETTGRVLHLARSFDLSSYDAAYLDLALRHGLAIATVDDRLATAAQAAGVAVLGRQE
jgi:predicted nucleic acid-binding protein